MAVPTPTIDKLNDLFLNCSVALFVTDGSGSVLLENSASRALLGQSSVRHRLPDLIEVTDGWNHVVRELSRNGLIENLPCSVRRSAMPALRTAANVSSANDARGNKHLFWMVRPELTATLPSEGAATPAMQTDAGQWIADVKSKFGTHESTLTDEVLEEVLALFFHHAPAGIHLLSDDGSVAYANEFDLNLVGRDAHPETFIGHHVRQIYQDQRVVEDFMGRWGEDAPIINFRANFVRADEQVQPVLIYSTANADNGTLENTRCICFRDPRPDLPRSSVSAFDFKF
jgi:PAS domain-containing protein